MSQSLMDERQSRVIHIASDGFLVYSISGAEPEETEDPDKNKKDDEEKGKEGKESETDPDAPRSTYSAAEYEQAIERMKAADRNRAALQAKVEEFENANKSELEKAKADLEKATARAEAAEKAANEAKIGREFLKFPGYSWHDPETALALVDLDSIELTEDGKVKGMKEAVEKLAKAKPFLLKDKKDEGDSKDQKGPPSGHNPSGRSDIKQERREELTKKYRLP